MEDRELDLDELENVHVAPNNNVNYNNALNNKDLYRQEQIKELEKLRESIINGKDNEQTKGSR